MVPRRERVEGGLIGLLVGDALGVPYEFHAPEAIPALAAIEYQPPEGFRRAHARIAPGTWSDDGAQALALLASLLACGRLDLDDLGRRLRAWYERGEMAVDAQVFDCGIQTARALRALEDGVPAAEAGPSTEWDNGNGSLMRVLPLALWHQGTDAELVADARAQSRVTHGHNRSQGCCALYCLWARRTLEGSANAWEDAVSTLRAIAATDLPLLEELNASIRPDDPPNGEGTGYVVDCLRSARLATHAGPYEAVVKAAIALGNDTDTTACVAGGIAGIRDGLSAIPERWRVGLRGREIVEPLLRDLLARLETLP